MPTSSPQFTFSGHVTAQDAGNASADASHTSTLSVSVPSGVSFSSSSGALVGSTTPNTTGPTPPAAGATPELDSAVLFGAGALVVLPYAWSRWSRRHRAQAR